MPVNMSGGTTNLITVNQTGGQMLIDARTYNAKIELSEQIKKIPKELPKLTSSQQVYLENYFQTQKETTLKGFSPPQLASLPQIKTILQSVCMLWWEEYDRRKGICPYSGTAFLATVPGVGVTFLSAGHNFESILQPIQSGSSLQDFTVHFGCLSGDWIDSNNDPMKPRSPPVDGHPMNLEEFIKH